MAILPSYFLDSTENKKVAVLFDLDATNTNMSVSEILSKTKYELLNSLNAKDSFNLIFSNLSITRVSDIWLPADSLTIETTFGNLSNPLANYSNLISLLNNGINFIKNNGNNGNIILVSCSDQYGEYQVANMLISDLLGIMNNNIPIHISDFQSLSFPSYYFGGRYFYGNEYFYLNLSKLTKGSFQRMRDGYSFSQIVNTSLQYLSGAITSYDLYTTLSSGFCHSKFNLNAESNLIYINNPILQIGKYKGTLPFEIELSGEYNAQIISKEIIVPKAETIPGDSISEEIWTGQYIKKMESQSQTNDVVNEIIFHSISERVLSMYTSFLCLQDTSQICHTCQDESILATTLKENGFINDSIKIYPSPFTDFVTIKINSNYLKNQKNIELAIYDIRGTIMYKFAPNLNVVQNQLEIKWNGTNLNGKSVPVGLYLFVLQTSKNKKTIKLIKQ